MNMMRLGVNSFLFTSPFATSDASLFAKVAKMGFEVFEMAVEEPSLIDSAQAKRHLEENGLKPVVCAVVGPDRDLSSEGRVIFQAAHEYLRFSIQFASEIDAKVVCGPFHSAVGFTQLMTEKERAKVLERVTLRLRALALMADDLGVRLAIEPLNRFENCLINTVDQALELIRMVGSPALGIHLDTFHMNIEEKDLPKAILAAGSRLYYFHACENDRGIPGTGHIPWKDIALALQEIEFSGDVVIESFTDQVQSIARSVSVWRKLAPSSEVLAENGRRFLEKELFMSGTGT